MGDSVPIMYFYVKLNPSDNLRASTMIDYNNIITIDPNKRSGKPCIRNLRITVYDVLSYLASGMSIEEVLTDFPQLNREDILACLSYAADRERYTVVVKS